MLEKGSLLRKEFLRFIIPSVVAQWVFALYTMVDGMFVAKGVGEVALSAVNISMPFISLLFALSLVLAMGTSTIVSIYFGKKQLEDANRVYTQNLVTILLAGLLMIVLVQWQLRPIALFLGASEATLEYVMTYVGTIALFSPCFMLSYYFEILIKADGRPRLATIMVLVGAVLNCILDYVFVFVVPWGVFGAAFATGISQAAVSLFFIVYFLSRHATLRLRRFRFAPSLLWRTFKLGLPSGITDFSSGMMIFIFNHAILTYIGEQAIVSYTIVAYVSTIVIMSMTGIAQGMQPLVSYYHGKGEPQYCVKLFRYGILASAVLAVGVFLPAWLGASGFVSLFISPENVALRQYSVEVFRIFSVSFLFLGFNILISGYFTAIEWEKSAIAISLARGFVLVAFSVWLLASLLGGPGIWWAPTLSEVLCLLLSGGLFYAYRKQGDRRSVGQQKNA